MADVLFVRLAQAGCSQVSEALFARQTAGATPPPPPARPSQITSTPRDDVVDAKVTTEGAFGSAAAALEYLRAWLEDAIATR